jgi:hypothetical protein
MLPIVNGLQREFGEQLAFEQRNASSESDQALLRTYGPRGHPSYVIVDETGKALWSANGPMSEEALRQVLRRIVSSSP